MAFDGGTQPAQEKDVRMDKQLANSYKYENCIDFATDCLHFVFGSETDVILELFSESTLFVHCEVSVFTCPLNAIQSPI